MVPIKTDQGIADKKPIKQKQEGGLPVVLYTGLRIYSVQCICIVQLHSNLKDKISFAVSLTILGFMA